MNKVVVFLFAIAIYWAFVSEPSAIVHEPGVLVASAPKQESVSTEDKEFFQEGFLLRPLAKFSIEARVLSKKRYRFFDNKAELAPFDLALGWGRMSDQSVIDRLRISQSNRFYFWSYSGVAPIPEGEIISSSANVHLIPKDELVFDLIDSLGVGNLIKMSGYLVEASKVGLSPWRSSLSRGDSGDGACEIFWVSEIERRP